MNKKLKNKKPPVPRYAPRYARYGEDIDAILDYTFLNFGANAMIDYHQSLENIFKNIDTHPELGIKADHVQRDYYCFYHRSHAIYYQSKAKGIYIIRVLHKSMDVAKQFSE